jgi:hypothetical protein
LRQSDEKEVEVAELIELLEQHDRQERQHTVLLVANDVLWELLFLNLIPSIPLSIREYQRERERAVNTNLFASERNGTRLKWP